MGILIYGGSFNPPHVGHVRAVEMAVKELSPERVFLIPTAIPPHKEVADGTPEGTERLLMTQLAAREIPGAEVLDLELRRGGKSYTVDTLRALREKYPGEELIFLLGTDMLLTFEQWREPETILSLAAIAMFPRESHKGAAIREMGEYLQDRYGADIRFIPGEPLEISSTELREALQNRQGASMVPEKVYAHIIRRRLYGAKPDYAWLRREAYRYLKPKRIPHVHGTEQEAVRLAKRWGESVDDAAEAAICHDITKRLGLADQLSLCRQYNIVADDYETTSEKLLHAKTGAAFAADLFGLSTDAEAAICWHTTGRAGMTALQKILYLADYIEPGRAGFDGLEELRKAAYEDLDLAMELGLRMSLDDVTARGYVPHGDTLEAHAWFMEMLRKKGLSPVQAVGVPDTLHL